VFAISIVSAMLGYVYRTNAQKHKLSANQDLGIKGELTAGRVSRCSSLEADSVLLSVT
jgi:hypothetical protein